MTTTLIENAAIATVDGEGTEYAVGHVLIEDGRIARVGAGNLSTGASTARVVW